MSATNTTPNIGLPSFIGTDKPSWLTDWNGAMSTIDTEVGSLKTDLSGDETRIGNLENSVSSLNTTVGNHTTSITALNTQVSNQGGTINTITSLIGNGTPTTTDQTIIGAINEIHAEISGKRVGSGVIADTVTVPTATATFADLDAAIIGRLNAITASLAANVVMRVEEIVVGGLGNYVNLLKDYEYGQGTTVTFINGFFVTNPAAGTVMISAYTFNPTGHTASILSVDSAGAITHTQLASTDIVSTDLPGFTGEAYIRYELFTTEA